MTGSGVRRDPWHRSRSRAMRGGLALLLAMVAGCATAPDDPYAQAHRQGLARIADDLAPLLTHDAITLRRERERLHITIPDGVDRRVVRRLIEQKIRHPALYDGYELHLATPPGQTDILIFPQ